MSDNTQVCMDKETYDKLIDAIAVCGNIYRKHDDGSYHNFDRKITLSATELGKICHVENIVWNDVKDKLNPRRSVHREDVE